MAARQLDALDAAFWRSLDCANVRMERGASSINSCRACAKNGTMERQVQGHGLEAIGCGSGVLQPYLFLVEVFISEHAEFVQGIGVIPLDSCSSCSQLRIGERAALVHTCR